MVNIFTQNDYVIFVALEINEQGEFVPSSAVMNNLLSPWNMGVTCDASQVVISQEAVDLLKKIPRGRDGLGDISVFKSNRGVAFGWLGSPIHVMNPNEDLVTCRDTDFSLVETSEEGHKLHEKIEAVIKGKIQSLDRKD